MDLVSIYTVNRKCLRSSMAEQRYRKPQVVGSSPTVGSVTKQSRYNGILPVEKLGINRKISAWDV